MSLSRDKNKKAWGRVALGLGGLAILFAANPSLAEDARTLPAGRSRFSFMYAKSGGIKQQFNGDGVAEDITKPYNMNLDSGAINTFAKSMGPDFANLVSLLNDTGLRYDAAKSGSASGGITATDSSKPLLGDALTKGFLGVDVEAVQSQSVFQYMTGVTDRLSVGFMIPIVTTQVRASASLSKINNTITDYKTAFSGMGAGFAPIVNGLNTLDSANIETLQQYALEANGYKRFGSSETSGIGDIGFGGRYNYLKTKREFWINSFQLGVTAPTGRTRPAAAITEVDMGTGNWDASLAHVTNYTPGGTRSPWMFSHGLHYTYRLPGKRVMRVRNSPDDMIPNASSEEEVQTHFADKIWTNLGARYTLNSTISFETNYEWYYHARDKYSGSNEAKDYDYLGDATEKYLETLNLGFTISMIDGYSNRQFPLPIDFSVNYYRPTRGKNALVAPFVAAELAMYF
jgi:hypothetical protein